MRPEADLLRSVAADGSCASMHENRKPRWSLKSAENLKKKKKKKKEDLKMKMKKKENPKAPYNVHFDCRLVVERE